MKGGARTAVAIGVGYYLGRRRKMRTATVMAVAAASGGLGSMGPAALKRGAKLLSSTELAGSLGPQVNDIVETVRGDLLDAAKAAATAAVTSRVESLSDNLHTRAETLRNPEAAVSEAGETVSGAGEKVASGAGGTLRRMRRRGEPAEEEEGGEERANGGRSRREASQPSRRARSQDEPEPEDEYEYEDEEPADEYDEDEGEAEAEAEEEPAPPRRRASRSPVTRTRR
jgi:hypothetical protein